MDIYLFQIDRNEVASVFPCVCELEGHCVQHTEHIEIWSIITHKQTLSQKEATLGKKTWIIFMISSFYNHVTGQCHVQYDI